MYSLLYRLHIPMDSLGGISCIDLCCSQICASEHTAHRFDRYTCREYDERCKGVASHVKGQRSFHPDVSLYVVHAIENNIGSRHVKDKACTLSPVPLHYRPSRGKYLHTIRSLCLHASALDAELAFFQHDVFLPKITDVGDCQTCEAGKDKEITDNAVVLPFNLQVDDALKFFLRDASRFTLLVARNCSLRTDRSPARLSSPLCGRWSAR